MKASADGPTALEMKTRITELEIALRSMRSLAAVSTEGDPWYAEHEGLDADAIFAQARKVLREEPDVPLA